MAITAPSVTLSTPKSVDIIYGGDNEITLTYRVTGDLLHSLDDDGLEALADVVDQAVFISYPEGSVTRTFIYNYEGASATTTAVR